MFRFASECWGWGLLIAIGMLPLAAVVALGGFLVFNGAEALFDVAPQLGGIRWAPALGEFGLAPLVLGTLACASAALLIAIPLGLATAVYLTLFAGPRIRGWAAAVVAVLGGLPSVVVGLWGMTWVVPWLGNSLASGAVVLALMVTPTFTLLATAVLRQAPPDVAGTARSLGVGDAGTAQAVILHARWGIFAALTLSASRALGEAVAISLVAGNVPALPSLYGPVATLTTTLVVEFDGAAGVHRSTLYLLALLVMLMIAAVSLIGRSAEQRRLAA